MEWFIDTFYWAEAFRRTVWTHRIHILEKTYDLDPNLANAFDAFIPLTQDTPDTRVYRTGVPEQHVIRFPKISRRIVARS